MYARVFLLKSGHLSVGVGRRIPVEEFAFYKEGRSVNMNQDDLLVIRRMKT